MAAPISFDRKISDPKPLHAEAGQAALAVLQELHEKGILSLIHGLVAGGGDIMTRLSSGAASPEAIRAMRNLLSLAKIIGRINPEILDRLLEQLPEKPELEAPAKPAGLWTIVKTLVHPDTRRGIGGALAFAGAFGKALAVHPQVRTPQARTIQR